MRTPLLTGRRCGVILILNSVWMDLRVATKYRLGPKIGSGSFGEIFEALNVNNGERVAIKLEALRAKSPCLAHERSVYRDLKGGGSLIYGLCHFHFSLGLFLSRSILQWGSLLFVGLVQKEISTLWSLIFSVLR